MALLSWPRFTAGLGAFAGDNYECSEKNVYKKAKFARGACLMRCAPAHNCSDALSVCRSHGPARCAGVDANVEGNVATLKAASEASRRTSLRKVVLVRRRNEDFGMALADYECSESDEQNPPADSRTALRCVIGCPRINCTRAIGLCFEHEQCAAVELDIGRGRPHAILRSRAKRARGRDNV